MSARVAIRTLACCALVALASGASAQTLLLERLPAEQLDVSPPSARVVGEPGGMRIAAGSCRAPADQGLRRRIVDIVVQEWAYFGFDVVDQTVVEDDAGRRDRRRRGPMRRFSWHDAAESARLAASIAGYWSATVDGGWILSRQNEIWGGPEGIAARWRDPWSAAFVSWVMCESGLGSEDRFRRHVAHHAYIDQAIEARDDPSSRAAFVAQDVGERALEPGDMVCSARRPVYGSIADRRAHLGVGMRSHCDIVVRVDAERDRILAIGGNVRGSVSLKLLPATFERRDGELRASSIGRGRRAVFAHLELRAAPVAADALETTPTFEALSEHGDLSRELERRLAGSVLRGPSVARETS